MGSGDLVAGSGLVAAITASATERGSLNLSGFKSDSTATGVAGTYQFSTATRGTLTMDADTSVTTDGNLTGLSLVVNSDSTFAGAAGAVVSAAGTIATTTLTVASDATTSGALSLGEVGAVHTAATVTLSELATNNADFNLIGATFTKLTLILDGGQAITAGTIANAGGAGADWFRVAFDGNADAIEVYNNTTEATITELVISAGSTTAANTLNVSYASKANVTSGSGGDNITGTGGVDTIDGGAGDDTITGGVGNDSLTGGSGADDFVYASATGGVDTITDFVTTIDDYDTDFVTTAGNYTFATNVTASTAAALTLNTAASGVIEISGVTLAAADAASEAAVIAAISNGTINISAASNTFLLVLNTTSGTYVYQVTAAAGNAVLTAADDDIALVGIFTNSVNLATGDFI